MLARALTLGLEPTYHTLYLPMHIHTYTCPSNPKVGKCTRSVARARYNTGNITLPGTLIRKLEH